MAIQVVLNFRCVCFFVNVSLGKRRVVVVLVKWEYRVAGAGGRCGCWVRRGVTEDHGNIRNIPSITREGDMGNNRLLPVIRQRQ